LSLDKLRNGINLRAYAQKDPIMEYKKEAFILYEDMILRAEELIVSQLSRINIDISTQADFTNRTDAKFVQSEAKNNNKKSKK
jgi:preprotein translocase subunit SecA